MKNLSTLIFTLIIASFSLAQQKSIDASIEAGPDLFFLRGNKLINSVNVPGVGFLGGIYLQYNFSNAVSLRTGIGFEQKGATSVTTTTLTNSTGSTIGIQKIHEFIHLNYLTVPLLFRKNWETVRTKYFINVGLFLGYLSQVNSGSDNSYFIPYSLSAYNKFDVGVVGGIGVIFPLKENISLSIELRNSLGLYNIDNTSSISSTYGVSTNSTDLLFGLSFPLQKQKTSGKGDDYR